MIRENHLQTRCRSLGVVGLLTTIAMLCGCGYALVGRGSNLPEDVRGVFLEPFENRTQRVQVEQLITSAIGEELVTRQRFNLVDNPSEADAVLRGAVVGFSVTPVTFDAEGRAEEYEISITAEVAFERTDTEELLWSNDRYLFRETYVVESSEESFFDRETLAIEETSVRFAETMVSDLLEGF